ncbi:PQQ-dependent sugar dehydrogenase [Sediminitomix flava]|uniref:Glucose/arabinose dehydrogenase n=1 Tax=Sediminitomix flava TaxID=379075 RepID=A0A315ZGU9_SEDFL|nr:sorbosone dehydrogenase family protein [Sediminitomix flava]PWJ44393.1 glucose/arabinose dehydrogenase [Sediminitomix flava]
MKKLLPILSILALFSSSCVENKAEEKKNTETVKIEKPSTKLPIEKLSLPNGFEVNVFAEDIPNARSLARGEKGTIFVGNRKEDKVWALVDSDQDGYADDRYVIAEGLSMPNGVALKDGNLYVAEVNRILRFDDIEANLKNPPKPVVIYDKFPTERHHGWKYIAFGPDGKLYIPVGAPCNICKSDDPQFASITRMNDDGSDFEVYAHGVRNTVGFDWHPETGQLWFTDNGRDMMGDDIPDCELNVATEKGQHFGYPYWHAGDVEDPEFGKGTKSEDYIDPVQKMGAHVAPLGMSFYTGDMFPELYKKSVFVAEHGSWNRSKKSGYKVSLVLLDGNKSEIFQPFIEGWLNEETQKQWGRPVDVLEQPDGSLLISDDFAGAIYRVTYKK